tara:strand:- start:226 stop:897 length:672 start_codon:yes stop_codon:yes gene_type:complete
MRIGISIDGVLRDLLSKVSDTYDKYFPTEGEDGDVAETPVGDYDFDKWLEFPEEENDQGEMEFNLDFDKDTFMEDEETINIIKTSNKVTVEEFLYEKCTLEVFGYAGEEITSAVETLNQLILDKPNIEFVLISREGGLAIPSTMFFLSKTKSICPNITFVKEYSKVWDHVDMMVTDHPEIIKSCDNRSLVIVDKSYNLDIVDGKKTLRIKTIKELTELLSEEL